MANRTLSLTVLGLLGCAPAFAQPPVQRPQETQTPIRATVEVVNVEVTVTDAKGNFVPGLKRENFRLLDNGAEQPIAHFAPVEAPAVVLVLVEASPTVFLMHRQHIQAVSILVDSLAASDQIALASYSQATQLLLPLTADKRAAHDAIRKLKFNMGMADLRFFDAVETSLGWLAQVPGKKALVLLTTGLDTSGQQWEKLATRLHASEVAVYAIALGGELRDYREEPAKPAQGSAKTEASGPEPAANPLSFAEADRVLREMAEMTGGRVSFPRKGQDLESAYRSIAATLRHRYSLGFAPPARDGQFHRILVQMVDDKGRVLGPHYAELPASEKPHSKPGFFRKRVRYRLEARRGYIAPGP